MLYLFLLFVKLVYALLRFRQTVNRDLGPLLTAQFTRDNHLTAVAAYHVHCILVTLSQYHLFGVTTVVRLHQHLLLRSDDANLLKELLLLKVVNAFTARASIHHHHHGRVGRHGGIKFPTKRSLRRVGLALLLFLYQDILLIALVLGRASDCDRGTVTTIVGIHRLVELHHLLLLLQVHLLLLIK